MKTARQAIKSISAGCFFGLVGLVWGQGFLTSVGPDEVPVVIVKGSAYEMGHSLGVLMADPIRQLLTSTLQKVQQSDSRRYSNENLDKAWETVLPHLSTQWVDQLRGLAAGSGLPYQDILRTHMIPVLKNYSCSGAAIWGQATADHKMYVFRNLDFSLHLGMQDFPLIVVCIPDDGLAHVNPTFAGFVGVQTGMNARGLALTEMGDSPQDDYPFDLDGIPFIALFSDLLYRTGSMEQALSMIRSAKRIKKYHYVIGAAGDNQGVKIKAHAPHLQIWHDNDPGDEYAPEHIFTHIVINAESRAPIAFEHIQAHYGRYALESVMELTQSIPIKGANLFAVVYDATDLKMYFSYAKGDVEAYQREFVHVDLKTCFDYDQAQRAFKVIRKIEP